jgi:hypothetical protein
MIAGEATPVDAAPFAVPATRLTPHQQREARERVASGEAQRSVARSHNVDQATISRLAPNGICG